MLYGVGHNKKNSVFIILMNKLAPNIPKKSAISLFKGLIKGSNLGSLRKLLFSLRMKTKI